MREKKPSRLKCEKGTFLVTTALFMMPMMGMVILSTDIGMAFLVRTEMNNGADLASLAAIKRFANTQEELNADTLTAIRQAAEVTGQLNSTRYHNEIKVDTSPVTGAASDQGVIFGFYDFETKSFASYTDAEVLSGEHVVNSIKTHIALGEGENEPFTFQFAKFLKNYNASLSNLIMVSEAVATFGFMNIVSVFDISASMDNETYKTTDDCRHSTLWNSRSRWFQSAARPEAYGQCENDTDMTVIGPQDPDHGVVMPQPMTDVFEVTRDVLLEKNSLFKGLYRGGLLVYETTAYPPYSPDGSVELTSTSLSNKESIKGAINFSIGQWQAYANNGPYENSDAYVALSQTYPNLAFPGGLNPPVTTFTNTGDAIFTAVQWITGANSETKTKSTDVIILFSDGLPNCYRDPIDRPQDADFEAAPECPFNENLSERLAEDMAPFEAVIELLRYILPGFDWDGLLAELENALLEGYQALYGYSGEAWSINNAKLAAEKDIVIHSVYFGGADEAGCSDESPGYQHLKAVAEITGGEGSCAENMDELSAVFEELSTKQSFVLVSPKSYS